VKSFASSVAVLTGHSSSVRPAMDWAEINDGSACHLCRMTGQVNVGLPQASTMPIVQRFGNLQLLSGFVTNDELARLGE
jgi:hypothetical protein